MFEIRLIVRTAHLLAAAAWVGGSILYLVVILPALRIGGSAPEVYSQIATLFRRIGQSNIRRLAKRTSRFSKAAPQLMLALGILVFLLGALLNGMFEATLAPT